MNIPVPVILSRVSSPAWAHRLACREASKQWATSIRGGSQGATSIGGSEFCGSLCWVAMYLCIMIRMYIYIYMYGGLMVIYQGTKWTITLSKSKYLPSLKLTAKAPENGPKPKRKRSSSNHPFSGVLAVSFREGILYGYILHDIYIYIHWLMAMNLYT